MMIRISSLRIYTKSLINSSLVTREKKKEEIITSCTEV